MTKKVPKHILNNFVYRTVHNNVYRKDMNAVFIVIGNVGKGKSTAAMRWGEDLDPNFSLERVAFGAKDFFKLINQGDSRGHLGIGSVIVYDEAAGSEDAIDSRRSLSKANQRMSWFTTISRARRLIIFYVCPFLSQLDKRVRLIGVTGIILMKRVDFQNKKGIANFYWVEGYALTDKTIMPNPRLMNKETGELERIDEIAIPPPTNKALIRQYKAIKHMNIKKKSEEWQAQMVREEQKKEGKLTDARTERKIAKQILKLHGAGKSGRQIARELGVTLHKVQKWVND